MNIAAPNNAAEPRPPEFPVPAGVFAETVVSVRHYTDSLFSFRITRPQSFRFRSGEFAMIEAAAGLERLPAGVDLAQHAGVATLSRAGVAAAGGHARAVLLVAVGAGARQPRFGADASAWAVRVVAAA